MPSGQDFWPLVNPAPGAGAQVTHGPRGRASGNHSGAKGNDEGGVGTPCSKDAWGREDPERVPAEVGGAEATAASPLGPAQSQVLMLPF